MTDNGSENIVTSFQKEIRKGSFICLVVQCMALTYFLIIALLFLAGLLFSGTVNEVVGSYYGLEEEFASKYFSFIITGTILFLTIVAGIIIFMMKYRAGFYIFIAAILVTIILDLTFLRFDWVRYLIQSGFIFLLGIAHFSRKCYR